MDLSFVLFSVITFLAVVLALEGAYNLWASKRSPEARRIARRLEALHGEFHAQVSLERANQNERMPRLNEMLARLRAGRRMRHFVHSAGVESSPVELILLTVMLAVVGFAVPVMLHKPMIIGIAVGGALATLPWLQVARKYKARVELIERQFPEALDLMGRAMRAGHAFPTAVKMVAEEMPAPLGNDFRILFDEMNYGVSVNDALVHLADRVPVSDVSYFVVAVMIQRESGGNLAELLDKISAIVRARLKLLGEIRTLSAEGRLSAKILTGLPFGVALAVNLVNPKFLSVLWTDPMGLKIVGVALVLMLVGILWMRKIIRIRV